MKSERERERHLPFSLFVLYFELNFIFGTQKPHAAAAAETAAAVSRWFYFSKRREKKTKTKECKNPIFFFAPFVQGKNLDSLSSVSLPLSLSLILASLIEFNFTLKKA